MDGELSHDDLRSLLGAYALDAIDTDEAEAVERHLATCPRCRAEVADHREVAALMAHAGAPAPEGLWDRIAASLEEAPPPLQLAPVAAAPAPQRGGGRRLVTALAAVAAAVAAVLGFVAVDQGNRIDELDRELRADALRRAASEAAVDPAAKVTPLKASDGRTAAEVVSLPDGSGYLVKPMLVPLGPDRTYQLWALVGTNRISAGVLGPAPTVSAFRAPPDSWGFAVTDEAAGGVGISENQPVAAGAVGQS